jgi:hypothetical protein
MLVLAHFGITILFFSRSLSFTHITQFTTQYATELAVNGIGFITDAFIAGTLAVILYRARSPFPKTNSVIAVLILYFVSTGIVMDICSLSALLVTVLYRGSIVPMMVLLIYPKRTPLKISLLPEAPL